MKQNIIHIIYSGLGGHANVLFPLLETDFKDNFSHTIIFYGIENMLPEYKSKANELGVDYIEIKKNPKQFRKPFKKCYSILNKIKPSSIFIHSSELLIPALYYSRKVDCQVIYIEHENNATKGFVLNNLSKIALKYANNVVCLNDSYKTELENKYTLKSKLEVISNGINTEKFKPKDHKPNTVLNIGMASRMVEGKDHKTLLKSFAFINSKLPKTRLYIAGDGPTLKKTKDLVENLNISKSVTFLGLINETEMISFYKNLDIYVQATLSETLSTSILQAMSSELCVVASDIPNNKLLIEENETGWLYLNESFEDLSSKIINIIEDEPNSLRVRKNAREEIKRNFSIKIKSQQYQNLILQK